MCTGLGYVGRVRGVGRVGVCTGLGVWAGLGMCRVRGVHRVKVCGRGWGSCSSQAPATEGRLLPFCPKE